jgi:hypothetical protein
LASRKPAVVFEEPPERPQQYDWQAISEQLRKRPMKWAKVFESDRASLVVAIRAGHIAAVHPDLGFEVTTTNNQRESRPRTCTLFLRYNPEKGDNLKGAIRRGRKE